MTNDKVTPPELRLVGRGGAWSRGALEHLVAAARWLIEQSSAIAGVGLVCAGVYLLWGPGWTLITAGVPCCGAYLFRSWLMLRRGK